VCERLDGWPRNTFISFRSSARLERFGKLDYTVPTWESGEFHSLIAVRIFDLLRRLFAHCTVCRAAPGGKV
jgi:hypothetical protein